MLAKTLRALKPRWPWLAPAALLYAGAFAAPSIDWDFHPYGAGRVGPDSLRFVVEYPDRVVSGQGAVTHPAGGIVRFVVTSNEPGWLVVVGVRPDGAVRPLYATPAGASHPIERTFDSVLPTEVRLTEAGAREYAVALLSEAPVSMRDIERAVGELRRDGAIRLSALEHLALPARAYVQVLQTAGGR